MGSRLLTLTGVFVLAVLSFPSAGIASADPVAPQLNSWSLAEDYTLRADATRPVVKDAAGSDVWYFKSGMSPTDPESFFPLTVWKTGYQDYSVPPFDLYGWGGRDGNPLIRANRTGSDVVILPHHPVSWPAGTVLAHPGHIVDYPGCYAVIRWRSPIAGYVTADISATDADYQSGNDGVEYWVLKNGSVIDHVEVAEGRSASSTVSPLDVLPGDSIYLVLGPRSDWGCDSTRIGFDVRETTEVAPAPQSNAWSLAEDYSLRADETRPVVKDAAGGDIWHFKSGRYPTDSAAFVPLSIWRTGYQDDSVPPFDLYGWGGRDGNALIRVNRTGSDVVILPHHPVSWPAGTVLAHPGHVSYPGRYAVVEWRSPVLGHVTADVSVADADYQSGNDGVEYWVIKNGSVIDHVQVAEGGSASSTVSPKDVGPGDSIYLVLGPRSDWGCDNTRIGFDVRSAYALLSLDDLPTRHASWGERVRLTGTLSADGAGVPGRKVVIYSSRNNGHSYARTDLAGVTDADGHFTITDIPVCPTIYRAVFEGDSEYGSTVSTQSERVVVVGGGGSSPGRPDLFGGRGGAPFVSVPLVPKSIRRGERMDVGGRLGGARADEVRIYQYRLVSGKWVGQGYVNAKVSKRGSDMVYTTQVRLGRAGKWRLRARLRPDANASVVWSTTYASVSVR